VGERICQVFSSKDVFKPCAWVDLRFVEEAVGRVGCHQLSEYRYQNEHQHRQQLQESREVVLHEEKQEQVLRGTLFTVWKSEKELR